MARKFGTLKNPSKNPPQRGARKPASYRRWTRTYQVLYFQRLDKNPIIGGATLARLPDGNNPLDMLLWDGSQWYAADFDEIKKVSFQFHSSPATIATDLDDLFKIHAAQATMAFDLPNSASATIATGSWIEIMKRTPSKILAKPLGSDLILYGGATMATISDSSGYTQSSLFLQYEGNGIWIGSGEGNWVAE